jgi:hypothetical protein
MADPLTEKLPEKPLVVASKDRTVEVCPVTSAVCRAWETLGRGNIGSQGLGGGPSGLGRQGSPTAWRAVPLGGGIRVPDPPESRFPLYRR